MIYTIGLFEAGDPDRNPAVLHRLAQATGARLRRHVARRRALRLGGEEDGGARHRPRERAKAPKLPLGRPHARPLTTSPC